MGENNNVGRRCGSTKQLTTDTEVNEFVENEMKLDEVVIINGEKVTGKAMRNSRWYLLDQVSN